MIEYMRSKKRGFALWSIIKIAVGIGFAVLLMNYAVDQGKGLDFERVYLSKDIALTVNGLYGMPADVLLDYENEYMEQFEREYNIAAGNSIIEVEVNGSPHLSTTYPYGEVLTRRIDTFLETPDYLAFVLRNGKITITKSREATAQIGCPTIYTGGEIKEASLMFEPGEDHGEGYSEGDLEEYQLTRQIADALSILCSVDSLDCRIVQQQDIDSKLREIRSAQKDLLVSIHIGSADVSRNPAIIRYIAGDLKSEKLACLISNILRDDFDPVEIREVDAGTSDKKLQVLEGTSPAVSLEIGNIKKRDFMTDPGKRTLIASAIIGGIKAYYGPQFQDPGPQTTGPLEGSAGDQ
ncbi:hypothetical protein GF345_06640 [Candidatus Woesearchaeota archaeon]|nr:hypothetical protein [Candidatus Woesearchaeota archaeon]